VHTGERIVRVDRVVEFCVDPVGSGVTRPAVVRQSQLHVRRIVGVRKISSVAAKARRWCALENVIHMAGRARKRGMRTRQGIAGHF
jgi:hypothetical protein